MLKITLAELRHHRRRMAALLASIIISVGFIVACVSFVETEKAALNASVSAETANADAVVDYSSDDRATADAARLATTAGVANVEPMYSEYVTYVGPTGVGDIDLASIPATPALRTTVLAAGAMPSGPDEVVLPQATADRAGVGLGDTLTISRSDEARPTALTVTGISDEHASLFGGLSDTGLAPASHFNQDAETDRAWKYLVEGDGSADDAVLVANLLRTIGDRGTAMTGLEYGQAQVDSLTNDTDAFGSLLLIFGAVALLVSSVIIANTLSVLVTQRRRQIGLLRVAGATRTQVRRGLVLEAAVLGLVGSILGVGLGLGVAVIAGQVTGSGAVGLQVPWLRVVAAVVVGVVVTVLAGLVPARRASAIAPIEALREAGSDDPVGGRSRVRIIIASGLLVVGAGLTALALVADANSLSIAIGGAGLLAVGIIVATPYYLPAMLRVFGRLANVVGPTGRLAAANAQRNPGRAAATCVALMLAVGLVMTLQVGAASTKKTTSARIADTFPVDVTVGRYDGTLSQTIIDGVATVPGITATVPVRAAQAKVITPKPAQGEIAAELSVKALGPNAPAVVQSGWDTLTDSTVLVSFFGAQAWGLTDGEQITLGRGQARVDVTVLISKIPDSGSAVVTAATLTRIDANAPVRELWAKAADKDDAGDVMAAVRRVAAGQPGTQVDGALLESAQIDQVLDVLVTVATALLGVAVLIAIIGVSNTLGLSVLERTRESALLRALGLQRRALRGMLVVEAVLLAIVATVIGIVAGIGFGWLGTAAVSRQSGLNRTLLVVPLGPTLAVVAVALVAGAFASLIPARALLRKTALTADA